MGPGVPEICKNMTTCLSWPWPSLTLRAHRLLLVLYIFFFLALRLTCSNVPLFTNIGV